MSYYSVPRYCGIYCIPVTSPAQPSWLPQVSLSTLSKIHDTASSTTLTQTFINPSQTSAIAKAKYTFPLYESCAVVSFRCYIGTRLIEGIVKEKEQAKAEYKRAVERGESAGLLEQHSPDVFSTSIGNIPAGQTAKVEIEYLIELKHDAEVDGLRFTIPTSIAPRYGTAPSGLNVSSVPGVIDQGGMKISVQLNMPSNIRSVQSPSHPIAMRLGGHIENIPDDAFEPKHALATLSQTSTALGTDFILLVKCADLSFPRALLEMHPTIPNSKALMVTLVPKFTLPPGVKPEIVFVVDRSGSMVLRMEPLKSALGVFLKSLPVGVKFNICSFGSKYSFLWSKSQPYSAESLEEANRHVQMMSPNMGGTEILPAIKATVSERYPDLPLEIMVLTDGEVWNTGELLKYVEQTTSKGDVRLFSLGIGKDVSHALVEGMARVGRGFAQIMSDEKEGMEGKVVRMLRGGLGPHVNDYRLEWEGKPNEVDGGKHKAPSPEDNTSKKQINLFDTTAKTEAPISFSDIPEFVVPSVLQAPYQLPPLFPFSRSTAYAVLSGDVPTPSSFWLRGTTPSGDELSLEIPVQHVPDKGEAIHKLAARKILQELEEGTGYIHSGKYGVSKEVNPGTFDEWVQREGVRVGVKYGLASKWTSFVAVQRREAAAVVKERPDVDVESVAEAGDDFVVVSDDEEEFAIVLEEPTSGGEGQVKEKEKTMALGCSASSFRFERLKNKNGMRPTPAIGGGLPPSSAAAPFGGPSPKAGGFFGGMGSFGAAPRSRPGVKFGASSKKGKLGAALGSVGGGFDALQAQKGGVVGAPSGTFGAPSSGLFDAPSGTSGAPSSGMFGVSSGTGVFEFGAAPAAPPGAFGAPPSFYAAKNGQNNKSMYVSGGDLGKQVGPEEEEAEEDEDEEDEDEVFTMSLYDEESTPIATGTATQSQSLTPRERTMALIGLQTFEGSFLLTTQLASLLDTTVAALEAKLEEFVPDLTGLSQEGKKSLWATVLAVGVFERKLAVERDVWELVVEKARTWMMGLVGTGYRDVERSGGLVGEVLDGSKA